MTITKNILKDTQNRFLTIKAYIMCYKYKIFYVSIKVSTEQNTQRSYIKEKQKRIKHIDRKTKTQQNTEEESKTGKDKEPQD